MKLTYQKKRGHAAQPICADCGAKVTMVETKGNCPYCGGWYVGWTVKLKVHGWETFKTFVFNVEQDALDKFNEYYTCDYRKSIEILTIHGHMEDGRTLLVSE